MGGVVGEVKKHRKAQKRSSSNKGNVKPAKEVGAMTTTVSLRESEEVFIKEMTSYIEVLKKQKKLSKTDAKIALIRTGVLTEDGKEKEKIVTWE